MEEYIFNYLVKVSNDYYLNYVKTSDYYSIGGITSLSLLKDVLTVLSIQNKYEVFIETERKNGVITYTIAGTKNGNEEN